MTRYNKKITPLDAAKELFLMFGEQTGYMGCREMFESASIDASRIEEEKTLLMLEKVQKRVRKFLGK